MTLLAADLLNWHTVTFLFFALLACGFGAAVLATSNIVRMAFYLTLCLGAISGLFFLAGAEFVGAMQLMIYVGGTLVLLIFGVMLTAQERFINMKTGAGEWVLGLIVGGSLLLLLLRAGFSIDSWNPPTLKEGEVVVARRIEIADSRTSTPIGLALSGIRVEKLSEPSELRRRGMVGYMLPFVIVSMHLLTVLIGAGYMARTKRVRTGRVLEAPARTTAPDRKMPLSIVGGIVSGVLTNLYLIFSTIMFMAGKVPLPTGGKVGEWTKSFVAGVDALPDWIFPVLVLTFLANIGLLIVVYYWQRWGLVGLMLVPLAQLLFLTNAGVGVGLAALLALSMLIPAVLLIFLCVATGRPTPWSQMD
ncbi:NADH-quinone oxidoreductase subunit J [Anatilimnocola aggregata]|uniref:NADH-quinone oxidoreductase subunit J n=1 Tax=Anatilimnocola aggregata TaxID=2528021 RepID=A0A517YE23_9BACT|nr:NADH-quinone oxidoreductase subunit J [Anatilimnocola aggregata]QDU28481.1 NADH-quinone oxidoreductase subunit J [Anatilimnocola aggregata]